jgi:hypothetical protein
MTKQIPLTQGKFALVDDDDFEWLNQWKWYYKDGYAARNITVGKKKQKTIRMHIEIMKPPDGMDIDHIHGDGLDNRKLELRLCTMPGNIANSKIRVDNVTGYKGVSFHKRRGKFISQIRVNNKLKHIGYYVTAEEAAHAYDNAAVVFFGQFARLNFPHAN